MSALTDLYLTHPFWTWMSLAAVLLALEVVTGSGYLLWPAAAAAAVGLITGLHLGLPIELLVFAALTIATTLLARRYLPKPLAPSGPDINDPNNRIVGQRGQAAASFTDGKGRVLVDGKEWAAELDDAAGLEAGAKVVVTEVLTGARVKVRPA